MLSNSQKAEWKKKFFFKLGNTKWWGEICIFFEDVKSGPVPLIWKGIKQGYVAL